MNMETPETLLSDQDTLYVCEVTEEEAGQRLDRILAVRMEGYSRNSVQQLIASDRVCAGGKPVNKSYRPACGTQIEVAIPPTIPLEILPEDIPLDILYEDKDLLVVNKPKGMVVHPAPGHLHGTLVNALLYHCKDSLSGINGVARPGIVHRIDRDTTGSLVVCKTDEAHRSLAAQIAAHSVDRIYQGIVCGRLKEDSGIIHTTIGRDPKDRKRMAANVKGGKDAITHYERIEDLSGNLTYARFILETGRTHQIRVHMTSIGHPLLGDAVYGPKKCPFSLEGQTLHAGHLGFIHPTTGEHMSFDAPLPAYFSELLDKLRIS